MTLSALVQKHARKWGPRKAKVCGERRSRACWRMFPDKETKRCNPDSDEARGKVHFFPGAVSKTVNGKKSRSVTP